jgi:hypothetical protein
VVAEPAAALAPAVSAATAAPPDCAAGTDCCCCCDCDETLDTCCTKAARSDCSDAPWTTTDGVD